MEKPLLVLTTNKREQFYPVMRALATLGIPAKHGILIGTGSDALQTPDGAMSPTNARDFLKRYAAIFVLERRDVGQSNPDTDAALNTWLTWNAPDDPPVVYFAPNLSTARTTLSLPADFPIMRPDPANLDATAVQMDARIFVGVWTPDGVTPYPKLGGAVFLTREQTTVYTPVTCAFRFTAPQDVYFWRLDEALHNALGANGEILAIPNFPDKTFPSSAVAAYRYKNRYFLPLLTPNPADRVHTVSLSKHGNYEFFWLLYALKLLGVRPARQAVLCFEIDHAIVTRTGRLDGLTERQQMQILEATYRYLAQFSQETGAVFGCWIQTGGRSRNYAGEWYYLYTHPDSEVRASAARIVEILRAHHFAGLPVGIHDHSAQPRNRIIDPYRRVGENRHPYAAPNDVPIKPGTLIAKSVMPTPPSNARDYGDYWDLGPTVMSGTGTEIAIFPNDNLYSARVNLYDQWDEALALGFADGYGGRHRYVGYAGNETGGLGWWEVWRELGFRGLRVAGLNATGDGRQTHPPTYHYKDLWFVPGLHWEWNSVNAPAGTYGLYSPLSAENAVQVWSLDANGDITSSYTTNANTRWKAYRRMIALGVGLWLRVALFSRGTVYLHPPSWWGADPNNPTGITDTGSDLKINPMVELTRAMRAVVSVVGDYVRFGGPAEVMNLLDEVGVF